MDSLPKQHLESLTGATRREAYKRIGLLCLKRGEGTLPEDQIAKDAGFESAEAMHHQLRLWGLAGLLPPEDAEQTEESRSAPKGDDERKGRGGGKGAGGKAEELPAAAGASELFEYAIDCLKTDLYYTNHLVEVRKGPIFEATFEYVKEEDPHPLVYLREQVPDRLSQERWEELCAAQGKDPASTNALYVYRNSRQVGGTNPWPTMHLVRLIAAYCICAKNTVEIEELLVRLHPNSREPDRDEVYKYIDGPEGVLPRIKKLAQVVRGKPITRGLNAVGEDLVHHTAGDFIRGASERGILDEEVTRTLREDYDLSEEEIARLKGVFAPHRSG